MAGASRNGLLSANGYTTTWRVVVLVIMIAGVLRGVVASRQVPCVADRHAIVAGIAAYVAVRGRSWLLAVYPLCVAVFSVLMPTTAFQTTLSGLSGVCIGGALFFVVDARRPPPGTIGRTEG